MMHFCRNAGRGYLKAIELVNDYWAYLFSGCWCTRHFEDTLFAALLLCVLIPVTPFVYFCVAPFVAFLEGTKEEEA